MHRALLLTVLLLPAAGCASAQAKPATEPAALEVPPVPPRLIDSVPLPPPTSTAPVEQLPASTPPPVTQKPRPPARDRTEAKPDAKPDVPAEPDPASAPPPPAPVPPLRTGASANGPEADRQIREIINRANRLLEGVARTSLSEDRKANYDSAKDSIDRAEEALRASNFVLARSAAERAENIAKRLTGR
jgi:hypothetical protein